MTISTEWTPKERLMVVAAIAARIESLVLANALKYRAEIAEARISRAQRRADARRQLRS